jgi:long-chain acyl-CoA synthetase
VAVFWACVARDVQAVPVDFRFSVDLVKRIQNEAKPKLLFYGSGLEAGNLATELIAFDEIRDLPQTTRITPTEISPDDVVEMVYTSGTTGEPKGVVHRHRNICANLTPFETEINKYKKWAKPFQPIRMLNLLPLSHMFGQAQGLFIPVFLEGSVVFTSEMHPGKIIRVVHDHRISVITSVPRILENLRNEVQRRFDLPEPLPGKGWIVIVRRWWRYRKVHRHFGMKFWAFVVGGAPVDPAPQLDLSAMSSLERVELLSNLEDRYQVELDEEAFSRITTTQQLEDWLKQPQLSRETKPEKVCPSLNGRGLGPFVGFV